ncbi:translation initiation factor IF-2 [Plectonema cf. radiosum LEGE 06105]|uniref:Translation initiation factor IF-2 n=1 Tax=Plectonema cf. radiosum LEGE 06105 TaxID=945769 RepID=A0A8J7F997_9CYAN|nr:translation initiation factor IF-2 [Plectonema radiosum]MBE9216680.1 translation initiation factor IF-2 [Plectonema cf. radiosum LEGE 06105]
MNNGKVRIYELSKELNLENKELLVICDQLNIAVKSHSSTISESDAERIRSQAVKLTSTLALSKEHGTNKHNHASAPSKPQILEIRSKPKPPNNSSNLPTQDSASNPAAPPRPFTSPVSPMEPVAPTAPASQNQSQKSNNSLFVENTDNLASTSSSESDKTALSKPEKLVSPKSKPEMPSAPELAAPPSRPVAAKPNSGLHNSVAEKPVLKRDRDKDKDKDKIKRQQNKPTTDKVEQSNQSNAPVSKTARPTISPVSKTEKPQKPRKVSPGGSSDDVQRPRKTVVRQDSSAPPSISAPLRPPLRPAAKSENIDPIDDDDKDNDVVDDIVELKRPTPPRLPRGQKKRSKQEEALDEIKEAAKAGKVVKNKRLKPMVEDDFDEDLLSEDEAADSIAAAVSNAIVRPPKPKSSRPAAAAPTPAAPSKIKKSGSRDQNRRRGGSGGNNTETEIKELRPEKLTVSGPMTVQELADALATPDTEIVKILFMKAIAVSITQSLDTSTVIMVANELEVEVEIPEPEAEARKVTEMLDFEDMEFLHRRPPVVTIMGHVDHGKTTLLDSIRKTKVASGEAGGITQHIGAYHVDIEHDGKQQQIVFLDTPGHEAFTAMRARGARVTDIAILVVAADDGVRPQTVEAISHAKAAGVPIIVAINKIDKEAAQPDRVKQELGQYSLVPEEWGGDTIMVPVSAIKAENLDTLLEMIVLVSEVEELQANPDRSAKGTVIEAHLDKAKGAVATLLIQNGTLHVGDILVAGSVFGKVRAMVDDRGHRVEAASPSFAVEVLGLNDVPAAGDEFQVFTNEKEARLLANERAEKIRQSRLMQGGRVTLTSISAQAQEGELKELNLILKADVQGSLEAILGALKQIPQNEVHIRMLLSAPGEITQTDIDLAAASGAVIIGFNTTFASGARQAADEAGVDVREYNIIYKLLEDIQDALEGLLEPELVEEPLGQAEVRAVFPVGRGAVAGCYVQSGKLVRNCKVRVRRGNNMIFEGVLDSLKRMKEDAREVNSGYECGIGVDKFSTWEEGDIIEGYQMVTKRRTLTMTR